MQFFEISGTLYALVMAIETVVLLDVVQQGKRLRDSTTITRHFVYHLLVMSFGGSTTIWMLSTGSYGEAGRWCWIDKSDYGLYFGYVPIWISIVGIVVCDALVIRTVVKSSLLSMKSEVSIEISPPVSSIASRSEGTSAPTTAGKSFQTSNIDSSDEKRAKLIAVFFRMFLYPLFLIILFVPGSIVRISEASSADSAFIHVFKFAQWMCDPAKGTLNAIMWVLSDRDVRAELNSRIRSIPFLQQFLAISSVHAQNLTTMITRSKTGKDANAAPVVKDTEQDTQAFSEVPEGHAVRAPWMSEVENSRYSGYSEYY
jgi:hypothetical protein